jgi:hypothetical protein
MAPTDREEMKAARELDVFLGFAEFAARDGLYVRPGSAVNRRPPEPDILCEVEGEGLVAFELVEIVDSTLAENISVAVRKGVPGAGAWVGDTTQERLRKKLDATYETAYPIELVMWANPFITPPDVWRPTFEPSLKALRGRSQFRRIWVVNLGGPTNERGVWFVDPPLVVGPPR